VEIKHYPQLADAISRGTDRRDWRSIAKRIEGMQGQWQLIETVPFVEKTAVKHRREEIKEKLRGVGCTTQVVALQGMNIHQRPWSGWAIFARIPRSVRAPNGHLI
jgi:hypothetical protein